MFFLKNCCLISFCLFSFFVNGWAQLSPLALEKIAKVEKVIQKDPGARGVAHFYTTALVDSVETLRRANHVAILTGFFIPSARQPETDGPLGALFLAKALMACGKKVTIITDSFCLPAIQACCHPIQDEIDFHLLDVALFPENPQDQKVFVSKVCSAIDCILSIERVGRSKDGSYRTMRGIDITQKTAPLDDLFLFAQNHPEMGIRTIAIGDGGNEIGMGDKQEDVKLYVPQGELIACVVPSDHLIVTGVSNWGGYALAGALWCALDQDAKEKIFLDQLYSSNEEQYRMLRSMVENNCCDGVLGKPALSVDGMGWEVHEKILDEIRSIIR